MSVPTSPVRAPAAGPAPAVSISRGRGVSPRALAVAKFTPLWTRIFNDLKKIPLKKRKALIELRLVRSAEMKKLNGAFRGKPKPTDVLSFPARAQSVQLCGTVIIDLDTAKAQAKEYNHSLIREAEELFIHGCLHLLGYDHQENRDAEKMKRRELKYHRFASRSE